MKKLLLALSLVSSLAYATGPSVVDARIQPLSINDQGELLYKYLIVENPTGGYAPHPMVSGLGIFKTSNHEVVSQDILTIDPAYTNAESNYDGKRKEIESWFNKACETDDLIDGFVDCNAQNSLKNEWVSLAEFNEKYGIDLLKAPHMTLIAGDIYAANTDKVYVEYDFDNFVLLQFTADSCEGDGFASLMITNTIMNDNANERNSLDPVPFDCSIASALIVK